MIWMRLHKAYMTVGELKRAAIRLKRTLPGGSSREGDRDTRSKVTKPGQIESNARMAAEEEEQIQPRDSPDPQEYMTIAQGLSQLPPQLNARGLEEILGPFPNETTCRVIDWVKEEVKRQSGNTESEAGKRSLLNTLHYLFESQNRGLAQAVLGSVESLSFREMTLTPIDCAVLSHVIGLCDTIKHLVLEKCHIQCEGFQRLGPGLHKCLDVRLRENDVGDSGVKLVSAVLRNPECKINKLELRGVGLTYSGAEDLASALSTNPLLTELYLGGNKLGDSGVKLVSAALRNPECKIQKLGLDNVGLTDSGAEALASALSTNPSLTELDLSYNKLGDSGVKLVSAALRNPACKIQELW
ncbi:NACHT, LRR and PYD domains-containing protein 3-like [Hypanus sabinus]|uniref:NACHT, LRR and PYD domains-containing protein 3-like n=1 Tax=Hypanus sabinus TaxID=79690 RepID=UPI0028C3B8C8|nr:NACHT, LRR and PYD domains-containing protein 3-like [Hypanus sabinus]